MQITINEGLSWLKTLKTRMSELIKLRDGSAKKTTRKENPYDQNGNAVLVDEPMYDAKALDRTIAKLAKEVRICESAIKRMNGKTALEGYDQNDEILGELV